MKKFIALSIIIAGFQINAQELAVVDYTDVQKQSTTVTTTNSNLWEHDFERAKKLAKKQNKTILVFFTGSDWCGPCKMLVADFFNSPKFRKIAKENLVLYEADFPRRKRISNDQLKTNAKLSGTFGVNSYPTILLLNSDAKEIGRKTGYTLLRETYSHYKFLKDLNIE